jgi:hypothetical protein
MSASSAGAAPSLFDGFEVKAPTDRRTVTIWSHVSLILAERLCDSLEGDGAGMMSWNELTRRQQRILIKLFGGGSLRGDDSVETADLIQRGLVTRNGLTTSGLQAFKAALKSQSKPDGRKRHNNHHAFSKRQSNA